MTRAIQLLALFTAALAAQNSQRDTEVLHLSAKELADYHKKLTDDLRKSPNQTGEVYRQGVSGGVGGWTPLPESANRNHYMSNDQKTYFYIMLEGAGTLLIGGEMVDAILADGRPGEWRAPRIANPRRLAVKKGDLINIPVKTPHQWDLKDGESVTYVILKVVERGANIRQKP
jgi:hypothetical protein